VGLWSTIHIETVLPFQSSGSRRAFLSVEGRSGSRAKSEEEGREATSVTGCCSSPVTEKEEKELGHSWTSGRMPT